MYEGLKSDWASDPSLLADLDKVKSKLKTFYQQSYMWCSQSTNLQPSQSLSSVTEQNSSVSGSPEKVNLTSWYQMKDRIVVDKVDEYLKLPQEDFECCKPLQWWLGRCSQFPNLYQLICDIFFIPGKNLLPVELLGTKFNTVGSAVSVEHIFSDGRDTISLCHASLIPNTIWVLLVKQHLRLAHISLQTDSSWLLLTLIKCPYTAILSCFDYHPYHESPEMMLTSTAMAWL